MGVLLPKKLKCEVAGMRSTEAVATGVVVSVAILTIPVTLVVARCSAY